MDPASVDPVASLISNTEAGFCSTIQYDKHDGNPVSQRVIIPKKLVDHASGLTVRAVQLRPEKGFRAFIAQRIVRVERGPDPLPEIERRRNTFATGEVVTAHSGAGMTIVFASEAVGSSVAPHAFRPVWSESWFSSYSQIVREAILDLRITESERRAVRQKQASLGLSPEQILAVHAYLLGEELMGIAAHGSVSSSEQAHLTAMADCLQELGGSPVS